MSSVDELVEKCGPLWRYDDHWFFAFLLKDGTVLGVHEISRTDGEWFTLDLFSPSEKGRWSAFGKEVRVAETSRTQCQVRSSSVIAIQELADT